MISYVRRNSAISMTSPVTLCTFHITKKKERKKNFNRESFPYSFSPALLEGAKTGEIKNVFNSGYCLEIKCADDNCLLNRQREKKGTDLLMSSSQLERTKIFNV